MIEDRLLVEEDLVLGSARLPSLSPGLRRRTLQAAVQAQQTRAGSRRAMKTACLLFSAMLVAAWTGAPWSASIGSTHQIAAAQRGQVVDGLPMTVNVRMRAVRAGDDWQLVEATLRAREMGSLVLRSAF